MGRRRRGRRSGGGRKTPDASPNVTQDKKESAPPKQSPQRSGGRTRRPRQSFAQRVASWIEEFPPPAEKIAEFLKVCGELRDSMEKREEVSLSEEEVFYWLASGVETLAEDELDRLFDGEYRAPLAEIRARHELEENKYWKPDDPAVPEEYRNLLEEFRAAKREVLARAFAKEGDPETAALVQDNYAEYVARREEGKRLFFARDSLESFRIPEEHEVPAETGQST